MDELKNPTKLVDIESICAIAELAGQKIMEIYQYKDFSGIIDFKADHSPLTLADKEANKIIEKGLRETYPEIPIISEEGKDIPYEERKSWNEFWLVDPLDGTKEFIKRNGEFTVNVALVRNKKVVLGVIYAPVLNTMYYGAKDFGAYKIENGNKVSISVGNKKEKRIAIGSRSHNSPEDEKVLSQYSITDRISKGSSLKFCLVAEGTADIYYRHGPTMEWDTAAGQAILEAAGGKMTNDNGDHFTYNKTTLLNGGFLCIGW